MRKNELLVDYCQLCGAEVGTQACCKNKVNIIFTHRLYPDTPALLMPNSMFIKQAVPRSICWRFDNSMIIRNSSLVDAGLEINQDTLKTLGY